MAEETTNNPNEIVDGDSPIAMSITTKINTKLKIGGKSAQFDLPDVDPTGKAVLVFDPVTGQAGKAVVGSGGGGGDVTKAYVDASDNNLQSQIDNIQEASAISVTYDALTQLIANNALVPTRWYLLNDYQTTHYILQTDNVLNVGSVEPLFLQATSTITLSPKGYSTVHVTDEIYYTVDNNDPRLPGASKGFIYRRVDTKNSNDIAVDFRSIKFRRWINANGQYAEVANQDPTPYQDFTIFDSATYSSGSIRGNTWSFPTNQSTLDFINVVAYPDCIIFNNRITNGYLNNITLLDGSIIANNVIENDSAISNTILYAYSIISNNKLSTSSYITSNTITSSYITGNELPYLSYISGNILENGSYISDNTMYRGTITQNVITYGQIVGNDMSSQTSIIGCGLNGSRVNNNIISTNSSISYANLPDYDSNIMNNHLFNTNSIPLATQGKLYINDIEYSSTYTLPNNVVTTNNFAQTFISSQPVQDTLPYKFIGDNTDGNIALIDNTTVTLGSNSRYNTFGAQQSFNTLGNNYLYNKFGTDLSKNTFGNNYEFNTFGNDWNDNVFGDNLSYNNFGDSLSALVIGNDVRHCVIGNGCHHMQLGDNCLRVEVYNCGGNQQDNYTFQIPANTVDAVYRNNKLVTQYVNEMEYTYAGNGTTGYSNLYTIPESKYGVYKSVRLENIASYSIRWTDNTGNTTYATGLPFAQVRAGKVLVNVTLINANQPAKIIISTEQ